MESLGPYNVFYPPWDERNPAFTWLGTRECPYQRSRRRGCDTPPMGLKCRAQPILCWERKNAGVSPASLRLMELVTELRRRFLQCCDQLLGGRRHGFPLPIDAFLPVGRLAIELVIGFIVGPKR